jgi:hypothetical protein
MARYLRIRYIRVLIDLDMTRLKSFGKFRDILCVSQYPKYETKTVYSNAFMASSRGHRFVDPKINVLAANKHKSLLAARAPQTLIDQYLLPSEVKTKRLSRSKG